MADATQSSSVPLSVVLLVAGLAIVHLLAVAYWMNKALAKPTRGNPFVDAKKLN